MFELFDKKTMVERASALQGRSEPVLVPAQHFVNQHAMLNQDNALNVPVGHQQAMFGMGCFWGAERKFWQLEGVYLTAVGYAAGYTPNPTYEEVCSGKTGHNEVVAVVFDPTKISYKQLLAVFWQSHNPTQGMQQGNDCGTQYRSGIYAYANQQQLAGHTQGQFQAVLSAGGYGAITTEVIEAPIFYFAEDYHQQYLAKNPGGYCGLGGTGVSYNSVDNTL